MSKKIEKLTAGQIAKLPEYVKRWTDIGLCTDLADRPRAENAIREMYRQGGLEPPKKIVWCGSPLSQGITRAIILDKIVGASVWASVRASVWASVGDSVRASVWASVRDSVWASVGDSVGASVRASVWASVRASVWASVRDSVWASVGDSVWASVGDSVWASVWASVGDSVRDSVWDSVRASVGASVGASVWDSVYSQHDAGWLAFYDFFNKENNLISQTKKLTGLWELSRSAGWALPHSNICWVSERHNILMRDSRGRLHSISGPACAYPDGWAIYAVHGVHVPAYLIEKPSEISVKKIDDEKNAEIRRVMIERYHAGEKISGAAAYMQDAGGKRLDYDERFGTLWHRNIPHDEPIVMAEVVNRSPEPDGTYRRYFLRCPPNMTKIHNAVAWSFGKTAKEYKPIIET